MYSVNIFDLQIVFNECAPPIIGPTHPTTTHAPTITTNPHLSACPWTVLLAHLHTCFPSKISQSHMTSERIPSLQKFGH